MTVREPHRFNWRNSWLLRGAVLLALVALVVTLTPSRAQRMAPGPTFPLTDEIRLPAPYDLADTQGEWLTLTVEAYDLKVVDTLLLKLQGRSGELYYAAPPAGSFPAMEAEASQQVALNVALDHVTGGGGAVFLVDAPGDLEPLLGARLLSVDGNPPTSGPVPAGIWLLADRVGDVHVVEVQEGHGAVAESAKAAAHRDPDVPQEPSAMFVSAPVFELSEIGGTSAGLALAMAWTDLVTDGDLTEGRRIAATGALASDGSVREVSGVEQKLLAAVEAEADLVLVPSAYDGPVPAGLEVHKVSSFDEALEALAP